MAASPLAELTPAGADLTRLAGRRRLYERSQVAALFSSQSASHADVKVTRAERNGGPTQGRLTRHQS
jgi:hypothetical protein